MQKSYHRLFSNLYHKFPQL